jgi:chromosome segregation ATPase
VPLVIVGHVIETRVDSVRRQKDQISTRQEETASHVARLTEEVAQAQADLRLTREQLTEVVRERIAATKARDSALFKAVEQAPSQADGLSALVRAQKARHSGTAGRSGSAGRARPSRALHGRTGRTGRGCSE